MSPDSVDQQGHDCDLQAAEEEEREVREHYYGWVVSG
jgi:hypothetical protein